MSNDAVRAIERHAETVGADPARLRYAADLWNEYVLALDRLAAPNSDRLARREQGVARLFELLGRAIDAGYRERGELETTPALAAFRDTPQFRALLEKLPR